MRKIVGTNRGLTLIELMVALVISTLIIAALYRTFVGQQKTYIVQEQVVEMRQNQRAAISNMMRELRMTGFGSVSGLLPVRIGPDPDRNRYQNVVNRDNPEPGWITLVGAVIADSGIVYLKSTPLQKGSAPQIEVTSAADFDADTTRGRTTSPSAA